MQYLQRLQAHSGVLGRAPTRRDSLRHFFAFADTMLDKILGLGGRYPADRIHLHRDLVLQKIARREGGLILTAHIGCLELCQVLAEQVPGFRITVLVHTAHAQRFNRLLQRLDPLAAVELVQVTEMGPATAVMLAERVAAGASLPSSATARRYRVAAASPPISWATARRSRSAPMCRRGAGLPGLHHGLPARGRWLSGGIRTVRRTHRTAAWLARRRAGRTGTALRALAGTQVIQSPLDWFNFFPSGIRLRMTTDAVPVCRFGDAPLTIEDVVALAQRQCEAALSDAPASARTSSAVPTSSTACCARMA